MQIRVLSALTSVFLTKAAHSDVIKLKKKLIDKTTSEPTNLVCVMLLQSMSPAAAAELLILQTVS